MIMVPLYQFLQSSQLENFKHGFCLFIDFAACPVLRSSFYTGRLMPIDTSPAHSFRRSI